jgi:hypothetical protein
MFRSRRARPVWGVALSRVSDQSTIRRPLTVGLFPADLQATLGIFTGNARNGVVGPGLGVLVVPDRHRAILPSKEGVHKTRDGSFVPVRAWRGDHKIDLTGRQGFCKFVARGLAEVELHLGPAEIEDTIVRLRKTLVKAGYDAGAATIAAHLTRDPDVTTPLLLWEVGHVEGAAGHHRRRARRAQQKRGSVLALSGNDQLTESI